MSVTESSPAVEQAVEPPARSLRARFIRGSLFEVGSHGAGLVLRMVSSVVLTRLLFPAAFGLSTMVSTVAAGLVMLSDVAVQPCVIQSKRGDEPAFLNTAFTIQAIRGVILGLVMIALAWPASWFWREPDLRFLISLASLQLFVMGLHSTSLFTMRRRLSLGMINALDFGQTLVTIVVTISLARTYRSAWVLVAGNIVANTCYVIATHLLPVGYRNRFHWDPEAAAEIKRFGRWVIGSSATAFVGNQADRVFYGRFLGASWLGVYGIAVNLAESASLFVVRLMNGVLYPALTHAARQPDVNISKFFYRVRLRLDPLAMGGMGLLGGAGGWLIHTLWDPRYAAAASLLGVVCVRMAVTFLETPTETCLFALGHTKYGFVRSITRLAGVIIFIPVGYKVGGVMGAIWGSVVAEVPTLLAVWPKSRALGILRLNREMLAVLIFCAAFAAGWALLPWLPVVHRHHHAAAM